MVFVVRLLLDPVASLRGQSIRGLREDLTTVSLPCYDLSPLCVGVWFVRPSVFVRPSIDRSQSVRGVSERPPPAYLALDDVPSLNSWVGLCLLVLFARLLVFLRLPLSLRISVERK